MSIVNQGIGYVNEVANTEISPDTYSTNNCVHNSRLSVPLQPQIVLNEQPKKMVIPEPLTAVRFSATLRGGGTESLAGDVRFSGTDIPVLIEWSVG